MIAWRHDYQNGACKRALARWYISPRSGHCWDRVKRIPAYPPHSQVARPFHPRPKPPRLPARLAWLVFFLYVIVACSLPPILHLACLGAIRTLLTMQLLQNQPVRHLSPWINAVLKDHLTARINGRKLWLEKLTNISPIGLHPLDVVEILKLRAGMFFFITPVVWRAAVNNIKPTSFLILI